MNAGQVRFEMNLLLKLSVAHVTAEPADASVNEQVLLVVVELVEDLVTTLLGARVLLAQHVHLLLVT